MHSWLSGGRFAVGMAPSSCFDLVRNSPRNSSGGPSLPSVITGVAVKVAGSQDLFANAARGMMTYLFGGQVADARAERTQIIEIEAPDREVLLVDWLSELLYRVASEYRAYVDFFVLEISDRRLIVAAGVVPAEAVDDIKAVTYHELSICRANSFWEATVVFDI